MTIISFIAINFGAIYRTTKSSYRDSPTRIIKECVTIHCCYDILCTALFKALFHVPLLYFEHLPLQRSLHGPVVLYCVSKSILFKYVILLEYPETAIHVFISLEKSARLCLKHCSVCVLPDHPITATLAQLMDWVCSVELFENVIIFPISSGDANSSP